MRHRDLTQHDYGEQWDHSDVRALIERRKAGQTLRQIADGMGRSYWAVVSKIGRLKLRGVDVIKGPR